MNNTHFVISNEDNVPFAVLKKGGDLKERMALAIVVAHDTENIVSVDSIKMDEDEMERTGSTSFNLDIHEGTYTFHIHPVWEY